MTSAIAAPSGLFDPLSGVALVTGAGSGIGAETVRSFSRGGVRRFALADVQGDKLKEITASLGPDHEVITAVVDVANAEQVDAFVDETVSRFGRLDYAVNSAGINGDFVQVSEYSNKVYDRVVDINQRGLYLCMKAQLRVMAKQSLLEGPEGDLRKQRGAIVNVSSVAGLTGFPLASAYTSSKHAVVGLTKSACAEFAAQKIRINGVAPGTVITPLTAPLPGAFGVKSLDDMPNIPAKRAGRGEEVGDVIAFLASENASYINGVTVPVDGGLLASA